MIRIFLCFVCLTFSLPLASAGPKPLETLKGCTFIHTDWADGDSFKIKTGAGEEHTIRLYGVDCVEWHINDETDARRLRAQRRYFGITEAAPKPAEAIEMAKGFGEEAAKKTTGLLNQPFTIHTRFRDALGDGKHKRIYAFVECADGSDLATELVKCGFARAFGVYADGPVGRTAEEYEDLLDDLELQAASRGLGIWAKTNWDKLPMERKDQRNEEKDVDIAMGKEALPDDFQIDPNVAARDDLERLPGVGEKIANRIIQAREEAPFKQPEDLLRVPGIKQKVLDKFMKHLEFKAP